MRKWWWGMGALFVPASGCGGHSSAAPLEHQPQPASSSRVDAAETPPASLPPGAMASVPVEDWPCSVDVAATDPGSGAWYEFDYGRLTSCSLPAELVVSGVVGCPARLRALRPGDEEPIFEIAYTYDERGHLRASKDGEAAAKTYQWTDTELTRDRDVAFTPTDTGFTADDDGVVTVAKVTRGRPTFVEIRYPRIGNQAVESVLQYELEWRGTRLTGVRGSDVLALNYDCRDAPRGRPTSK